MDAKPRAFMCYLCGTSHFSARWGASSHRVTEACTTVCAHHGEIILFAHAFHFPVHCLPPLCIVCFPLLCAPCLCSLTIHIPQCYEKWLKVEGAKDPRERREPPPPPAELDLPLPSKPEEIDAFNQVSVDRLIYSSTLALGLGWQIRFVMGCTLQSEGCDVMCHCYGLRALMFVCQSRPHQPTLAAFLRPLTHPQIPPSPHCCLPP